MAPPTITQKEFSFLNCSKQANPRIAISIVFQSTRVVMPICIVTASISATDAMFTASKKEEVSFDLRSFGMNGVSIHTKMKDGKNIPTVEANAPLAPEI